MERLHYYSIFVSDEWQIRTLADVMAKIVKATGIEAGEITSKSRVKRIMYARHLFCAMARKKTSESSGKIGKFVNVDHATVLNSVKIVKNVRELSSVFNKLNNGTGDKELRKLYNESVTRQV